MLFVILSPIFSNWRSPSRFAKASDVFDPIKSSSPDDMSSARGMSLTQSLNICFAIALPISIPAATRRRFAIIYPFPE